MDEKQPREPASRPGEPTSAPPGSSRKIRVLMERAMRREALFHPGDNKKRRPAMKRRLRKQAEQEAPNPLLQMLQQQEEPREMAG